MAPNAKHRGVSKQPELLLDKYVSGLDGVPDEVTLGRLQSILETLLSERSHPMIVGLRKQVEQLKTAENVIHRELESRKLRNSFSSGRSSSGSSSQHKRKRSHSNAGEEAMNNDSTNAVADASSDEESNAINGVRQSEDSSIDKAVKEEEAEGQNAKRARTDQGNTDKGMSEGEPSFKEEGDVKPAETNDDEDVEEDEEEEDEDENEEGKGYTGDGSHPTQGGKTSSKDVKIPTNKKFVANPKSEFVPNQSLPYHTFVIFNEHTENEDEETYKRRLGVVSYPKEDLSTLTAGPVPMEDFTRAKPTNQVQFSTYATFLEPYFRPFTDEDVQFLQQPTVGSGVEAANLRGGKRLSPYAFPPLGPHYQQQWAIQDAELAGIEPPDNVRENAASRAEALSKLFVPKGSVHDLGDQSMESHPSTVSLGPFSERLVAAVMPEIHDPALPSARNGTPMSDLDENNEHQSSVPPEKSVSLIPPAPSGTPLIEDFGHLEERVKGEFRYVGVLDLSLMRRFERAKSEFKLAVPKARDEYADPSMVDMDWVNGSEDDEISRELRLLQSRLKEVTRRNTIYKQRLTPVLQEQLAWQEYQSILQDLDKQVDQAYQKRLKQPKVPQPKQKKRKDSVGADSPGDFASPATAVSTPDAMTLSRIPDQKPAIKAVMDKRERWINKIGPLFRPAHEMMREYENPKFNEIEDFEAPDDDDDEEREE